MTLPHYLQDNQFSVLHTGRDELRAGNPHLAKMDEANRWLQMAKPKPVESTEHPLAQTGEMMHQAGMTAQAARVGG